MKTNHQMNYYDYAKTLSAEGNMTALMVGGDKDPLSQLLVESFTAKLANRNLRDDIDFTNYEITFNNPLPEGSEIGNITHNGYTIYDLKNAIWEKSELDDRIYKTHVEGGIKNYEEGNYEAVVSIVYNEQTILLPPVVITVIY